MTETVPMTDQITSQVGFLKGKDWLNQLAHRANSEFIATFESKLKPSEPGMGYCMDEREVFFAEDKNLKPAFVAGAPGWRTIFMMTGSDFQTASVRTRMLYQKMRWGQLEAHTDNNHGHITDPQAVQGRDEGCGYLKVWHDVAVVLHNTFGEEMPFLKVPEKVPGVEFIEDIRKDGKIIPLKGDHKLNEAVVVVNLQEGSTLDVNELYATNPAFRWDAWATKNETVRQAFNTIAQTDISADQFFKLQAGLHIVTGLFLNAIRLEGANPNLVIIPAKTA